MCNKAKQFFEDWLDKYHKQRYEEKDIITANMFNNFKSFEPIKLYKNPKKYYGKFSVSELICHAIAIEFINFKFYFNNIKPNYLIIGSDLIDLIEKDNNRGDGDNIDSLSEFKKNIALKGKKHQCKCELLLYGKERDCWQGFYLLHNSKKYPFAIWEVNLDKRDEFGVPEETLYINRYKDVSFIIAKDVVIYE